MSRVGSPASNSYNYNESPHLPGQQQSHQSCSGNPTTPSSLRSYGFQQLPQDNGSKPVDINTLLARFGSCGGMDVEFIILSLEIKSKENEISNQLKTIQRRNKLKEAIGKKLDALRNLKTQLQGELGGGDKTVSARELNKLVNNHDAHPTEAEWKKINEQFGTLESTFVQDPDTGAVTEVGNTALGSNAQLGKEDKDDYRIDVDRVDTAIEKLNDLSQRVGSDNEIDMIKLKDLIDKKSQLIQLLSNINKKKNDTQASVIANFK
jgi:hypothetical protein